MVAEHGYVHLMGAKPSDEHSVGSRRTAGRVITSVEKFMPESSTSWADKVKAAVVSAVVLDKRARAASEGQSLDLCDNIDAFSRTIAAPEKEMTRGSFLPLRTVMNSEKVSNSDHSNALSFLSGGASDGGRYGPQSGEIVGILKQLMDETSVDFQTLEKEELDRKTNHWTLVKAKTGEISVLAKTIEEKMVRVETLAVEVSRR